MLDCALRRLRTPLKFNRDLFNHPVAKTVGPWPGSEPFEGRRKGDGVAGERVLLCLCSHLT